MQWPCCVVWWQGSQGTAWCILASGCRSASAAGKELDAAAVDKGKAALAWQWTTSQALYPTKAVGDALAVSRKMHEKYRSHFTTCE